MGMKNWKTSVLKAVFSRYMSWRLQDLIHPDYAVVLEYPIHPEPRYGEGKPAHPEMTLAYMSQHSDLSTFVNKSWERPIFQRAFSRNRQLTGGYMGTSFWLRMI